MLCPLVAISCIILNFFSSPYSGSDADLDFVEREEEEDDDLLSDKRRSGRRAGPRKKYVDDVQLDLSDDENLLMNLPPGMFTIILTLQKHYLEFLTASNALAVLGIPLMSREINS